MSIVKVMSFDLDGTLIDYSFVDSVWLEGVPQLYSFEKGISFEDAREEVKREYNKIGKGKIEWYDLHYWIRKFGLNVKVQELLNRFEHKIKTYPEVPRVLNELKQKGFRLIIVTNANREFAELELRKVKIDIYFKHVFSSTSDFGLVKKTVNLYRRVCSILEVSPWEMVHIGDDRYFDFDVPRRLGILAFYLDRKSKHKETLVIPSLEELIQTIRMK